MMLIITLVVSFLVCCRLGADGLPNCSLTAPNLQSTTNQERKDQCGNQHHSRKLLMMSTVMLETCFKPIRSLINE